MKIFRFALVLAGVFTLLLSFGYIFHVPAVIALWPWSDGPLSYLFVGSILASASASMLWIGWSGELAALQGGTLNILVIMAATAVYFGQLAVRDERTNLLPYVGATILMAFASALVFAWSLRLSLRDPRPTPGPLRISFGIFLVALVLAATALLFRQPIFPWALNPDSSVVFGCIFLGNASYFLYGLLRPRWHNALGQLLSFLAYDAVLIVPFLMLFSTVKSQFLLSLGVYVAVLIYSAGVAVYYLFVDKATRLLPG